MTKFQIHDQQPSQQNKKKWLYVGKFLLQQSISLSDCFARKKNYSFLNCKWAIPPPDQNKKKKIKWNIFYDATTTWNKKKKTLFQFILASFLVVLYNSNIHVNKTNTYFQTTNNYIKIKKLTQTEYFLLPGRSFSLFFSFYTSTGFPCQKWCMYCHLF